MRRRFWVVLLVVLLVLAAVLYGPRLLKMAKADLGDFSGGGDYGGSDWGSSSWDSGSSWGSSSWDSDDDDHLFFLPIGSTGDGDGMGGILFYVILFVIVMIIISRKGQGQHPAASAGSAAGAKRTPDSKLTPLSEYAKLDPNFSAGDMREKLSNLYVQMQNACTARDIEPLRPYFSDALYQQFDRQIKGLIVHKRINYVERISVLDVDLRGYFQEGGEDHLVAELKTRITDYTVEEATGKVVSGSKTAEKFMTYEWDLSRPTGTITEKAGETTVRHCPNCGAPLSVNESARCPYCDSVITFYDHDWTIYAVKGLAQRTVQS